MKNHPIPILKIFVLCTVMLSTIVSYGQGEKIMALYEEGNALYRAGRYAEAIPYYTSFIEATDEPLIIKRGHINRGLAYDRLKEYDKAVADFTIAIRLDSTDMASFIDRGLSQYHAENYAQAKTDFHFVIAKNQDQRMRQNALYWLAQIEYKSGNMQACIDYCTRLLKSAPQDYEVLFLRASAFGLNGDQKKAIKDYSEVIKLKPETYQAYANRGIAKINLLTTNGNIQPSRKQTKSACKDLAKAREMGDTTVEDMLFVYCEKPKK